MTSQTKTKNYAKGFFKQAVLMTALSVILFFMGETDMIKASLAMLTIAVATHTVVVYQPKMPAPLVITILLLLIGIQIAVFLYALYVVTQNL